MNSSNGDSTATETMAARPPAEPERNPRRALAPLGGAGGGRSSLLWKMVAVALVAHLALILLTSKGLFVKDGESPEAMYEKGDKAMAAGQYLEAMEHYRRVLDLQPKVPPIFEKAAEAHRNAERQAKLKAAKVTAAATQQAATAPVGTGPTSVPVAKPEVKAEVKAVPAGPDADIPPELRGK